MKVKIGKYPKHHTTERRISVEIDDYDLWSLDHTLSLIILPALVKFRNSERAGVPSVFLVDMTYDNDEQLAAAEVVFNDVLDKMIYSFECISGQREVEYPDTEGKTDEEKQQIFSDFKDVNGKHEERIQEGLDLFGKYFRVLWD